MTTTQPREEYVLDSSSTDLLGALERWREFIWWADSATAIYKVSFLQMPCNAALRIIRLVVLFSGFYYSNIHSVIYFSHFFHYDCIIDWFVYKQIIIIKLFEQSIMMFFRASANSI